jgi:hypothetical protein
MWRRLGLVRTGVSQERVTYIFRVENSSLAEISTLKMGVTRYSETSVLIRSTRRHISEDGILQVQT